MRKRQLSFLLPIFISCLSQAKIPDEFKEEVKKGNHTIYGHELSSCWSFFTKNDPDFVTYKKPEKRMSESFKALEKIKLNELPDTLDLFFHELKLIWGKEKTDYSSYPKIVTGITEVLYHDGKNTDRSSNAGIIGFMNASVEYNEKLFMAAYRFYRDLRSLDRKIKKKYKQSPIHEKAPDLYALALKYADNDPYLALKVMAIFGHDNSMNALSGSCQAALLHTVQPLPNSILYLSGALPQVVYSEKEVEEGKQIASDCNATELTDNEKALCNDNKPDYEGDYYHVIAASYLGCRQARAVKSDQLSKITQIVLQSYVDKVYLNEVRQYKIQRFMEELKSGRSTDMSEEMKELLMQGLERIKRKTSPVLDKRKDLPSSIKDRDYQALKAILHRYEFEVNFRVSQHKQGLEVGRGACKDLGPLEKDLPTVN